MSNSSNHTSYDNISDGSKGVKNQDSVKEFSEAEESLIAKMFKLVGNRSVVGCGWPLIAGRIPGRTAEEIEKYWNSRSSSANE